MLALYSWTELWCTDKYHGHFTDHVRYNYFQAKYVASHLPVFCKWDSWYDPKNKKSRGVFLSGCLLFFCLLWYYYKILWFFRCGNVGGSTKEASWNPADFILLMLQGCLYTMTAPDINWQVKLAFWHIYSHFKYWWFLIYSLISFEN